MIDYFISNKEKYRLIITIGDGGNAKPLYLEDIEMASYTNQMNRLYIDGYIIYTDKHGDIDRFVEDQMPNLKLEFSHDPMKCDGSIAPESTDQIVSINFLVNNFEILENKSGYIKYKIYVKSDMYPNLFRRINITTYKDGAKSVTDIIRTILENHGQFRTGLFDANKSDASIQYISNTNDNVMTSIRYLLNKTMYDNKYGLDKSVKALIYDENAKIVTLFDTKPSAPRLGEFQPISITVMKNDGDISYETPINMGYMANKDRIDGILDAHRINAYHYDFNTNQITSDSIDEKSIVNFFNGEGNNIQKMYSFFNGERYNESHMDWCENTVTYEKMFDTLTKSNGLIVNQYGLIGTIPGYSASVTITNSFPIDSQDKDAVDNERQKYQSFTGKWDIFKVQHFISPPQGLFRQKLVMYRNQPYS